MNQQVVNEDTRGSSWELRSPSMAPRPMSARVEPSPRGGVAMLLTLALGLALYATVSGILPAYDAPLKVGALFCEAYSHQQYLVMRTLLSAAAHLALPATKFVTAEQQRDTREGPVVACTRAKLRQSYFYFRLSDQALLYLELSRTKLGKFYATLQLAAEQRTWKVASLISFGGDDLLSP